MKKYLLALTLALSVFLLPSSAFALFNVDAYTGYSFGENFADFNSADSVTGFGYGARAHYYSSFITIIGWGLGGYVQYSPLEYEMAGITYTYDKTTVGFDGFLTLNLPIIPLHPYVRAGVAAYDKTITSWTALGVNKTDRSTDNFGLYYGGFGVSLGILPLPVFSVQIFAEYLYEYTDKAKNNRVNIGASIRA